MAATYYHNAVSEASEEAVSQEVGIISSDSCPELTSHASNLSYSRLLDFVIFRDVAQVSSHVVFVEFAVGLKLVPSPGINTWYFSRVRHCTVSGRSTVSPKLHKCMILSATEQESGRPRILLAQPTTMML